MLSIHGHAHCHMAPRGICPMSRGPLPDLTRNARCPETGQPTVSDPYAVETSLGHFRLFICASSKEEGDSMPFSTPFASMMETWPSHLVARRGTPFPVHPSPDLPSRWEPIINRMLPVEIGAVSS
jgi:hypothetical protein